MTPIKILHIIIIIITILTRTLHIIIVSNRHPLTKSPSLPGTINMYSLCKGSKAMNIGLYSTSSKHHINKDIYNIFVVNNMI